MFCINRPSPCRGFCSRCGVRAGVSRDVDVLDLQLFFKMILIIKVLRILKFQKDCRYFSGLFTGAFMAALFAELFHC